VLDVLGETLCLRSSGDEYGNPDVRWLGGDLEIFDGELLWYPLVDRAPAVDNDRPIAGEEGELLLPRRNPGRYGCAAGDFEASLAENGDVGVENLF